MIQMKDLMLQVKKMRMHQTQQCDFYFFQKIKNTIF